jgi:hypothetical protein
LGKRAWRFPYEYIVTVCAAATALSNQDIMTYFDARKRAGIGAPMVGADAKAWIWFTLVAVPNLLDLPGER